MTSPPKPRSPSKRPGLFHFRFTGPNTKPATGARWPCIPSQRPASQLPRRATARKCETPAKVLRGRATRHGRGQKQKEVRRQKISKQVLKPASGSPFEKNFHVQIRTL